MDQRLMSDLRPATPGVRRLLVAGYYRRLGEADWRLLRAHLLRLNPDDQRSRFMAIAQPRLVDSYVRSIDWQRALLLGRFVGRSLRGVAELYPIEQHRAEMAISVERRFQGAGIGKHLLSRIFLLARNRGYTALEFRCLANNQRMRHLVQRFDGQVSFEAMEAAAVVHSLPPTAATFAAELVEQATVFNSSLCRYWLERTSLGWHGRSVDMSAFFVRPRSAES